MQNTAAQGNCTLIAPADPLSAQGLATPYQLTGPQGMTPQASGCTMANAANNGAFVQAVIVSPAGQLSVYDPLVITQGTAPAAQPVVPQIPPGSVVGIWTGFNGNVLTIAGPGGALFSQGLPGSPFGQVAAVNAPAFFAAARQLAQVPALGTARDGLPCPTTRDFSLVDQDPSDNVTAQYILTGAGQTAQDNAANEAALGTNLVRNGSDNNLLARFVDPALGCAPFEAPDLTAPGRMTSAQGLDELQAAADQAAPVALVPPNDPMTTAGVEADINPGQLPGPGNLSPAKTNLYRANVGQPALAGSPVRAATRFCRDLRDIAPGRLAPDAVFEGGPSPMAGMTLAQFLAQRLTNSLTLLNCRRFGRA